MPALVTIEGINQALSNLACKPDTLRSRLISVLLSYFPDEKSLQECNSLPAEEIIAKVWQIDAPEEIKKRRKNLSSLKSALNKSLKDLAKKDLNPEGIIIGRDNVFEVSDEQKTELLQKLGEIGPTAKGQPDAVQLERARSFTQEILDRFSQKTAMNYA